MAVERPVQEQVELREEHVNVSRQKLVDQQFNFKYYTNVVNTKNNTTYYYCYEFGYRLLENNYIMVVKQSNKPKEKTVD